ncbi:MAG: sugar transferase (PEP-CTERM/EpsH1 system associated) [Saprospiraceae bacterium]|jgi:sugar transferase (PEP-CTERM/EpsH1 system associated)
MCPRFPYPLEKGDKLRIFHQLRFLGKMHQVLLIAITDEEISKEHLEIVKSYVYDVKIFKLSKVSRFFALFKSAFSKFPFQVSYYFDQNIAEKIERVAKEFNPDHIYCQLTRMSEYAKNLPYPKTLDYMDAFGVGMERRAKVVSGIYSYVYKKEAARMKAYESEVLSSFDHHTIISEQDAKHIANHSIDIIPNGIDTEYFAPIEALKKFDIGFIGNMGYPPNIDAAEYLVNKVLPLLDPETKVIIAGARPDKRVKQLSTSTVAITGWMDDVRTAYAESYIFVAPLWLGTGQQNKILEAMAMGLPCVTSSSVNNAIGAKNGKEILIADTEAEFAASIKTLMNDPELYKGIRRNALTFVREQYSWEHSVGKLSHLMFDS